MNSALADLRVLIVDDEPLARRRLRDLLGDLGVVRVAEAGHAPDAVASLARSPVDLLLLDIHMPGLDGLSWARQLAQQAAPPAIVFVTADAQQALTAFEVSALDYLTKPVRRERLAQALARVARSRGPLAAPGVAEAPAHLRVLHRSGVERIPLSEVLCVRADLKYLTVWTGDGRQHLLEGSLADLEQAHGHTLLRVHRNALVARAALRRLERGSGAGDAWQVRLAGLAEPVPVSRRLLPVVREVLGL